MRRTPRINLPLVVLAYLEIVLWTACVFNAGAAEATAGASYLGRETGNLKCAAASQGLPQLPLGRAALLLSVLHQQHRHFEHLFQQQLFSIWSHITGDVLQQAHQQAPGALSAVRGLPAPFTSIAAID